MKCDGDIRKDLQVNVMSFDGVVMFQGISERTAKNCNVS